MMMMIIIITIIIIMAIIVSPLSCVMCSRLMFPYLVCFLSSSDVIIS